MSILPGNGIKKKKDILSSRVVIRNKFIAFYFIYYIYIRIYHKTRCRKQMSRNLFAFI